MNLYQLEDNLMQVVEMAESADESDQQKFDDTIDSLKDGILDKAVSYAHVIKQLKADSKQLNEKIKHDVAVKCSIDNNVDKLKGALQQGMEMAGKDKIKDLDTSIWIQKNAHRRPQVLCQTTTRHYQYDGCNYTITKREFYKDHSAAYFVKKDN